VDSDESQPALAALDASLALLVEVEGSRITGVRLGTGRPIQAARVLEGRSAESALAMLPLLYRLCGTAQSVAGLRAVEAAFDCGPGPAGCAARSLLVGFEALEQSLWRILLDWPRCVGGRSNEVAFKLFRKRLVELRRGVFTEPQWNQLGGARVNGDTEVLAAAAKAFARDVDEHLFGSAQSSEVLQSRRRFDAWFQSGSSPTAVVFDWVASNQLEDFGGVGIQPANGFDAEYISDRIARDDSWEYCGQPDHHGEVRQTGALARLANTPFVRELHDAHGYGLATQLAARLLEVSSLLGEIREQILTLAHEEVSTPRVITTGCALGSVDTARGRLFHWVEVRDGDIARYRTLAPTEWNFHPRGPLVQGLTGAPAKDLATTRRAVELLVTAIDPCVGVQLEIAEA
jgi:Ni,Fe-hydrogenase III large subunit